MARERDNRAYPKRTVQMVLLLDHRLDGAVKHLATVFGSGTNVGSAAVFAFCQMPMDDQVRIMHQYARFLALPAEQLLQPHFREAHNAKRTGDQETSDP